MIYREEKNITKIYKEEYLKGVENIIAKRQNDAKNVRNEFIKDIFSDQDKYRDELKKMLGWPLTGYETNGLPEVVSEKLSQEDGYCIYRMQFEVLEGLKMTGLLFKADGEEKAPLVIAQHGGMGTPELISGIYDQTHNYNDMLQRIRKNKVHVFAPQLLLWDEIYNVDFDRKVIDARLKMVGSSITAIEIFGIQRILDYFEQENYVSSFGMVGLSYGGFYTLFTSAVDTRIKSAISCSFFCKRDAVGWSDWSWLNSAEKFDDAEIACLVYPRKLHIAIGNNDNLFNCKYSTESFEEIRQICKDVGTAWVTFEVFDGTHEFFKNDEPIERLVNDIK